MKRIRVLGLGVVMALTLAAIANLGTASAAQLKFDSYPASVKGTTGYPEEAHYLTTHYWGKQWCGVASFTGEAKEATNSLQVTPNDLFCWGDFKELKMQGCKYTFNIGAEMPGGSYQGTMDIGPSGCGPIYRHGFCQTSIPAQKGLGPVTYKNIGEGSKALVEITAAITKLKYSETGTCTTATYEDGEYKGTWLLTGEVSKTQVGARVEAHTHQPRFEPEVLPATVKGSPEVGNPLVLNLGGKTTTCKNGQFTDGLAFGALSILFLKPTLGECETSFGTAATFTMNSCLYSIWAKDEGSPYNGTFRIFCEKEGDEIELNQGLCKVRIPAQEWFAVPSIVNSGSVKTHVATAQLEATGLKYSVKNVFACPVKEGSYANGIYTGGITLGAYNGASEQVAFWVTGYSK